MKFDKYIDSQKEDAIKHLITYERLIDIKKNEQIRPVDMFLFDVINNVMNFVFQAIKQNKKHHKFKKIEFEQLRKIAESVLRNSCKFLEVCLKCKTKCLHDISSDGQKLFEINFFQNGNMPREHLPDQLKTMTKFDFFLAEISIEIANSLNKGLEKLLPIDFVQFIYFEIIDLIVDFTKTNCHDCHISCLDNPLEDNFSCFQCMSNENTICPYNDNRKKYFASMPC